MDWNLLEENTPLCGLSQLWAALGSASLPVYWKEIIVLMLPAVANQLRSFEPRPPGWWTQGANGASTGTLTLLIFYAGLSSLVLSVHKRSQFQKGWAIEFEGWNAPFINPGGRIIHSKRLLSWNNHLQLSTSLCQCSHCLFSPPLVS